MGRLKMLWEKSAATLKHDGIRAFFLKTVNYIKKNIKKEDNSNSPEKMFMDVLFINGCFLPHPSRYRVTHQREQMFANGVSSNEIFYENLSLDLVKRYRVFIFFRCPYTEMVGEFIKSAKSMNKMVCRVCLYRRPASVLLRTFRKDIVLYILILLLLLLFVNSFS